MTTLTEYRAVCGPNITIKQLMQRDGLLPARLTTLQRILVWIRA